MDGWKKIMAKRIAEKAKGIAKKTWDANKSLMMFPAEISAGAPSARIVGQAYEEIKENPGLIKKYARKRAIQSAIARRISQNKKGM